MVRRVVAISLMIAVVGCSGDGSKPEPSTPTTAAVTSTVSGSVAPSTTTTPDSSSTTTTTTTTGQNPGTEAITVTEKITITIIEPEDG